MTEQNSDEPVQRDLWGRPSGPLRDRRGRRSFRKDPQNQDFVAVRAAKGWSQKRIATAMGIDEKTLRKNFSRELQEGLLIVEGEMLDVLLLKAREGHVPSARLLLEQISKTAPRGKLEEAEDEAPPAEDAPTKKQQRDLAAQEAPDDYADLYSKMRRPN